MTIEEIGQKISPLLKKYDVEYAGVFGSVARGEDTIASDIDLLVKFQQPLGMFTFIHLENELTRVLDKKVDLATEQSLHRLIKKNVLRDLRICYGKHKS